MIRNYRDFLETLEIEIEKLRDAEDYLNDEGKLLLRAYRKIRWLTSFAENCQELLEVGLMVELDDSEKQAARLALRTVERLAKVDAEQDGRTVTNQELCEGINAICDQRCQFRDLEQEDLDDKCRECPVTKLADMIGV